MQKFTLKLFILAFFLTIPKSLFSIESLAKTALVMDLSTGSRQVFRVLEKMAGIQYLTYPPTDAGGL